MGRTINCVSVNTRYSPHIRERIPTCVATGGNKPKFYFSTTHCYVSTNNRIQLAEFFSLFSSSCLTMHAHIRIRHRNGLSTYSYRLDAINSYIIIHVCDLIQVGIYCLHCTCVVCVVVYVWGGCVWFICILMLVPYASVWSGNNCNNEHMNWYACSIRYCLIYVVLDSRYGPMKTAYSHSARGGAAFHPYRRWKEHIFIITHACWPDHSPITTPTISGLLNLYSFICFLWLLS